MVDLPLYPPSPADVPADMRKPSGQYRKRVALLLISLFLFVVLYLALLIGSAWLTWWAFTHNFGDEDARGHGRGSSAPILNLAFGVSGAMLFLFLLKGLVKGQKTDRAGDVEINERDEPELFAFIHRLCKEVGAPRPARVCLSGDVNAAVIYDTSFWSLFFPPKKRLLIGLGLVNAVTLSEFKATVAHEFGHFAQSSLRLGSYVYVANRVLYDVVYSRDSWDDWLLWWSRLDPRIAFPAYALRGIVWGLRLVLGGAFKGITLIDRSLSRQMEFNADDAAASVAGSDAIVHVLCRLEFAGESLSAAARDLFTAADHGLFTRDLFHHQTTAAERIRRERKLPRLGLPPLPPLPPDDASAEPPRVFDASQGDEGIPPMWRTHPANYEREANAKRFYLRVDLDERSPWLLFKDAPRIKEQLTRRFYKMTLERREEYKPNDPAAVQTFIDAEHAETTYDPKYHGLYDDRFVNPGEPNLIGIGPDLTWPDGRGRDCRSASRKTPSCAPSTTCCSVCRADRWLKGKTFPFRGTDRTPKDVNVLLKTVKDELEKDGEQSDALDAEVFTAHFHAARRLEERAGTADPGLSRELIERYRFHVAVQKQLRRLMDDEGSLGGLLNWLSGKRELESNDFQEVVRMLEGYSASLEQCVRDAEALTSPSLTNVAAGTRLSRLIWDSNDDVPRLQHSNCIDASWIGEYARKLGTAIARLRRIHFKSLGNILTLQERIAASWREAPVPPAVPEVSRES